MSPPMSTALVGSRNILAASGLIERRPPVRSSDFRGIGSPFHYYLGRKLGLVPALRWSQALSHGTWFHAALELLLMPDVSQAKVKYDVKLETRLDEIRGVCTQMAVGDTRIREILATEDQDAQTAWAWAVTASAIPIEGSLANGRTLHTFLNNPDFIELCCECTLKTELKVDDDRTNPIECVIQPDRLLYQVSQKSIWIVDYKTTGISPRIRAASCPIEPQTQHYMMVIDDLINRGTLQGMFDLPDDISVGGMLHAIIKKPTISFGQMDRDFMLDTSPFKSGPRKGEPRNEKQYLGEPRLENYMARCKDWYLSQGDYLHTAGDRATDPLVNLSFTSGTALLDKAWTTQYAARLQAINRWRLAQIEPEEYPWPTEIHGTGTLDPYAPFVLRPVSEWADIVMQEGFMVVDRDATQEIANV